MLSCKLAKSHFTTYCTRTCMCICYEHYLFLLKLIEIKIGGSPDSYSKRVRPFREWRLQHPLNSCQYVVVLRCTLDLHYWLWALPVVIAWSLNYSTFCKNLFALTHIHTSIHTHIRKHTHTHAHAHARTHVHTHQLTVATAIALSPTLFSSPR